MDPVSTVSMLKDLKRTNEGGSTRSESPFHSPEKQLYIKCILERCIPKNGQIHHPLNSTFDPGDFVCGPLEIFASAFDRILVCGRQAGEVELGGG